MRTQVILHGGGQKAHGSKEIKAIISRIEQLVTEDEIEESDMHTIFSTPPNVTSVPAVPPRLRPPHANLSLAAFRENHMRGAAT